MPNLHPQSHGRGFCILLTFALLSLAPSTVLAQATIAGVVRDASGGVLPGVTVEASSPALIEKVRSATSDGTGQYRIVDLRPGTYAVTFTLPGFGTVKREGLVLAGSFTATVNADLAVGLLQETVTVTGESPVVDVQGVARQQVLGKEIVEAIPTGRTHFSVGALVPAVTGNNAADVGGSNAIAHVFLTTHGGRPTDMRITLDGLSTQSAEGSGHQSGYTPNIGSTQELVVDFAAGSAEQATGGVRINIVPREGGNTFSGNLFGTAVNAALQGSNFTDDLKARGLTSTDEVKFVYDFNPAGGGPIVRDKLWIYVAARWNGDQYYVGGLRYNLNAGNPNAWTYVPDPTRKFAYRAYQRSANGRLTWQASQRDKLSIFYDDQVRCWCPRNTINQSPEVDNSSRYPINNVKSLTWSSPRTNRLLVEAGTSHRSERWRYQRAQPGDPRLSMIGVTEQSTGFLYRGGPISTTSQPFQTSLGSLWQYRGAVSFVTGSHALKVGFSNGFAARMSQVPDDETHMSYRFNNGVPNQITMRATPWDREERTKSELGIYVQEKWTVSRLTVNAGVRFDYFNSYYPEQHLGPAPFTPNRDITLPKTPWVAWKDLTPRTGVSYDVFGNGKTAAKVTLNKYVLASGIGNGIFGAQSNPIELMANVITRSWNDANRNYAPECDLLNPLANGECGVMSDVNFGLLRSGTEVDPSILRGWGKRGSNWEFSTGVQHELLPSVSMDLSYFRRWYANFPITENRAVTAGDFAAFSVTAPLHADLPGGGGNVISGFVNLNPNKVGQVNNYLTDASTYGKQSEYWHGVDFSLNTRLPNNILLQGGVSTGRTVTDNCDVLSQQPEINPTGLPYCHQATKFLTQIKAFGAYTIPVIGVQASAMIQSIPGPQLAANYVATSAEVAPSLGRPLSGGASNVTVNLVAPGQLYGERLNQVDLRVSRVVRIGRTRTQFNLDLFNALNASTALTENANFATWRRPQTILQARFVKLGASVDF